MKKIRLLTTAAAIALFASMILTGCGGGGKAADTGGGSAVQQSSGDSGEKMLKVATHWEKATFDPALWGDGGSVKARYLRVTGSGKMCGFTGSRPEYF